MAEKFLFLFDENYLNRLHAEKVNNLEKKDIQCWTCGKAFERKDLIFSKTRRNDRGCVTIKRHALCALRINLISKAELKKLQKYRTVGYSVILTAWLCTMHLTTGLV